MSYSTLTSSRRVLSLGLSVALVGLPMLGFQQASWAKDPLKGGVRTHQEQLNLPTINPDEIKEIEAGTQLDMVISTPLTTGVSIDGDEFFAKVTRDYVVDGKVVIPRGTLVHGIVDDMANAKRAGRNAHITTRFDYMITPDGREIPIDGGHSTRDSKAKAAAKVVGRAAGFTAVGGLVGTVMVLKYGGIAAVAASNGYALAGGAAVGGAVGLTAAMATKGKSAMIQPGAEIKIKLQDNLVLPTVNMPDAEAENYTVDGLDVNVLGMRIGKDAFGEHSEITLTLEVDNFTEHTFSTFEIALEDEYGTVFFPSPFGDTGMWFSKMTPNSKMTSNVTFNVNNPKLEHKLVFFKQYTREPVAKISLANATLLDKKEAKALDKNLSISR